MALSIKDNVVENHRLPYNEQLLRWRADLLAPADRVLFEAVVIRSLPTRLAAQMTGMSQRSVRARVHYLSRHVASRRFMAAARALPQLTPAEAELAKMHFCQRLTQRQMCRSLGVNIHTLRRRLDRLTARIETLAALKARASTAQWACAR